MIVCTYMLVIINVSKVVIDWSLTMRRKDYYDGRSHGRIYVQTNTCGLFTIRTMCCMSVGYHTVVLPD